MNEDQLIDYHKKSWDVVKSILPNDLSLPALNIASTQEVLDETVREFYLTEEIAQSGRGAVDMPNSPVLKFMFEGEMTFLCGGVTVPRECLSDDALYGAIPHEQVHELTQSSSLMYLLTPQLRGPIAGTGIYDFFREGVAHVYGALAAEKLGVSKEDYFIGALQYNRKEREAQGEKIVKSFDEELKGYMEVHDVIAEDIKGFDPLSQAMKVFDAIAVPRLDLAMHLGFILNYNKIKTFPRGTLRRRFDRDFEEVIVSE